jgi:hypothetical protein
MWYQSGLWVLLYAMGVTHNGGPLSHSVSQCPVLRRCILRTYVYQFTVAMVR